MTDHDADTGVVLTGEELTLIAGRLGASGFPGATPVELDEDGWNAVARGLLARGLLRPPGDEQGEEPAALVLASAVLGARDVLWLRIAYAEGEGDDRVEALWLVEDLLVRQTIFPSDLHVLRAGERADAEPFVDAVLAGTAPGAGAPAPTPEDARRVIGAEGRRLRGEDRVEGEAITLVEAAGHGLWVVAEEEAAATPIAPLAARDLLLGLAGLAAVSG